MFSIEYSRNAMPVTSGLLKDQERNVCHIEGLDFGSFVLIASLCMQIDYSFSYLKVRNFSPLPSLPFSVPSLYSFSQ
jgi:hypothetical protein